VVPTADHHFDPVVGTGGAAGDWGAQFAFDHLDGHLGALQLGLRGFAGGDLPQHDPVRKYVALLRVVFTLDYFGGHPLLGADFASHFLAEEARPAEVAYFDGPAFVEHQVKTLQVAVEDGGFELVELVHATRGLECEPFAHVPVEVMEGRVQHIPEAAARAVLHD